FSFPLADLRHCKRAGSIGSTVDTQTLFPVVPNIKEEFNTEGLTPEQLLKSLETQKQRINERMSDFYINTLRVFSRYVLGFELSVPRDK
ncbi:hypothetical protein, partial [Pseudoalteromonas sp. GW168-MNA-CIBAN-0100]